MPAPLVAKPNTKGHLFRVGAGQSRLDYEAPPYRFGELIDLVAIAMEDQDELWRYSIVVKPFQPILCAGIRRLSEQWAKKE